jgi:hypothetical protein
MFVGVVTLALLLLYTSMLTANEQCTVFPMQLQTSTGPPHTTRCVSGAVLAMQDHIGGPTMHCYGGNGTYLNTVFPMQLQVSTGPLTQRCVSGAVLAMQDRIGGPAVYCYGGNGTYLSVSIN